MSMSSPTVGSTFRVYKAASATKEQTAQKKELIEQFVDSSAQFCILQQQQKNNVDAVLNQKKVVENQRKIVDDQRRILAEKKKEALDRKRPIVQAVVAEALGTPASGISMILEDHLDTILIHKDKKCLILNENVMNHVIIKFLKSNKDKTIVNLNKFQDQVTEKSLINLFNAVPQTGLNKIYLAKSLTIEENKVKESMTKFLKDSQNRAFEVICQPHDPKKESATTK